MWSSQTTLRLFGLIVVIDAALVGLVCAHPTAPGDQGSLPTLRQFMSASHSGLQQAVDRIMQGDESQRLVITMGNEAADLDSMISAMTYSYWRHLASDDQTMPTTHVPLINTPREDLLLNRERERVIVQSGQIPYDNLVCIDDAPIKRLFQWLQDIAKSSAVPTNVEIVLVDHPAPNGRQAFLEPFVRGLLDHHIEEGKFLDAIPRWVSLVGSAASLTTLEGFALLGGKGHTSSQRTTRAEELDQGDGRGNFLRVVQSQPNLFRMLLAPIVLDTGNFDPVLGKTKDEDLEAAALIWEARPELALLASTDAQTTESAFALPLPESCRQEAVASGSSCQADFLTTWFKDISQAQQDIDHLTATEQLRKDYKQGDMSGLEVGVGSITWPMQKWSDLGRMQEFEAAMGDYYQTKGLDLLGVTTLDNSQSSTGLKRELVLYSPDFQTSTGTGIASTRHAQLIELVKRLQTSNLELAPIPNASEANAMLAQKGYIMFNQGNLKASRKQVLPELKKILKDIIGKAPQAAASSQAATDVALKSPVLEFPIINSHPAAVKVELMDASEKELPACDASTVNPDDALEAYYCQRHSASGESPSAIKAAFHRFKHGVASMARSRVAQVKAAMPRIPPKTSLA